MQNNIRKQINELREHLQRTTIALSQRNIGDTVVPSQNEKCIKHLEEILSKLKQL